MDESSSHMGHLFQFGWYSMVAHSELERSTMLFMGKLTKYLSPWVMGIHNDWDSPYSFDSWWPWGFRSHGWRIGGRNSPNLDPTSRFITLWDKTWTWEERICTVYVFTVTKKEGNMFLILTWLQYPILKLTKQLRGCCYSLFHANRMIFI